MQKEFYDEKDIHNKYIIDFVFKQTKNQNTVEIHSDCYNNFFHPSTSDISFQVHHNWRLELADCMVT